MACPFFVPREIVSESDGSWPHPSRLPLGAGWTGTCRSLGTDSPVADEHIRDFCNLGYATTCPRLPLQADWDAVRFSVARTGRDQITLCYTCERNHAPIEHGNMTFDLTNELWLNAHSDPRVQTLAGCYLQSYRARQKVSLAGASD